MENIYVEYFVPGDYHQVGNEPVTMESGYVPQLRRIKKDIPKKKVFIIVNKSPILITILIMIIILTLIIVGSIALGIIKIKG